MAKQNYITLSGKIKKLCAVETFTSGFTKRDVWVCIEEGKYPNVIPVTFKKDKIGELNGYKEGDEVSVSGFLSGHIWEGDGTKQPRCFLSLEGWKIGEYKGEAEAKVVAAETTEAEAEAEPIDDMPF